MEKTDQYILDRVHDEDIVFGEFMKKYRSNIEYKINIVIIIMLLSCSLLLSIS